MTIDGSDQYSRRFQKPRRLLIFEILSRHWCRTPGRSHWRARILPTTHSMYVRPRAKARSTISSGSRPVLLLSSTISGVEFMTGLRRAAPRQVLSKTPKMEPAVGEPPNGGARGWELRVVHRDLQPCGCTDIKCTESAVSISRTARQAD